MSRSSKDYLRLLQSLLPRGKVWSRAIAARLTEYLYAEADELARIDDRAQVLLRERNTLYTTELIEDHENELGLPDECTRDYTLSLNERRLSANSKLTATGGQSKPYFIAIAAKYGYTATITENTPAWCGIVACGDPIGPLANIFYWTLTIFTDETPIIARCGEAACGDVLQKVSDLINTVFCFANKYKPAHTILQIALQGNGFNEGFSQGFDALPAQSVDYLSGGFTQGFSLGFNVNLGGAFADGFSIGFEKPA